MLRGETRYHERSRFLGELPADRVDAGGPKEKTVRPSSSGPALPSGNRSTFRFDKPFKREPVKAAVKADRLDYAQGDTVSHIKFGTGTVLSIVDGGKDYEVTVDFEKYGVKKMFAGFAKLKKL